MTWHLILRHLYVADWWCGIISRIIFFSRSLLKWRLMPRRFYLRQLMTWHTISRHLISWLLLVADSYDMASYLGTSSFCDACWHCDLCRSTFIWQQLMTCPSPPPPSLPSSLPFYNIGLLLESPTTTMLHNMIGGVSKAMFPHHLDFRRLKTISRERTSPIGYATASTVLRGSWRRRAFTRRFRPLTTRNK